MSSLDEGGGQPPPSVSETVEAPSVDEAGEQPPPSASETVKAPAESEPPTDEVAPPTEAQPPKWMCPKCDEPNKAQRDLCNMCGAAKPGAAPAPVAQPQQPVPDVVDQALDELLRKPAQQERWNCAHCDEPNKGERDSCNMCGKPRPGSKQAVKQEKKEERWTCPKCDEVNKAGRDRCNNCNWVKRSSSVVSIGSDDSPEKPPPQEKPVPRTAPAESVKPQESKKRSKSSSSSSSSTSSRSSSSSSSSSAEKFIGGAAERHRRGRRSPPRKRSASPRKRSASRRRRSPSRRRDSARPHNRKASRSRSKSFRRPKKTVDDHPMFKRGELDKERREREAKWEAFVRNEEREREEARRNDRDHKDDPWEKDATWDRNDKNWHEKDSKDERYKDKDDWKDKNWKNSSWKEDSQDWKKDKDSQDWKKDKESQEWKKDRGNDDWKNSDWKKDRDSDAKSDWKKDNDGDDWKSKSWKDKDDSRDWKKSSWKDNSWGSEVPPSMPAQPDAPPPAHLLQSTADNPVAQMAQMAGLPQMTPVSGIGPMSSQDIQRTVRDAILNGMQDAEGKDADWRGRSSWDEKTDQGTWGTEDEFKKRPWRDKNDDKTWSQVELCGDFKRGRCTRGDSCRYSHAEDDSQAPWSKKRPWEDEDTRWAENDWKKAKKEKKEFKKDKKEKDDSKKDKKEKKKKQKDMPEKLENGTWEEPRETVGLSLIKDLAEDMGQPWEYPLWDESRRSFAGYLRSPFSQEENKQYFETIREGTQWLQPTSQWGLMPRKTAWLVKPGCMCTYSYGPFEVEPCEFPPWMIDLMTEVMPKCGYTDPEDWPDSCNMNLYEDGGSAVGWHADDESLFQGKFQDIAIISVSFGATRKFELRLNWPEEGEESLLRFMIQSGDIMTMEGMVQKHMQHRVPKEERVSSPRINLTWRWVRKHTPRCPAGRKRCT